MKWPLLVALAGAGIANPGHAQSDLGGSLRITAIVNGSQRADNSVNLVGSVVNSGLSGNSAIHAIVNGAVSSQGGGGMVSIGSVYRIRRAAGVQINVSVAGVHHSGSGNVIIGGIHAR